MGGGGGGLHCGEAGDPGNGAWPVRHIPTGRMEQV